MKLAVCSRNIRQTIRAINTSVFMVFVDLKSTENNTDVYKIKFKSYLLKLSILQENYDSVCVAKGTITHTQNSIKIQAVLNGLRVISQKTERN